jgi:hypothetical protein
MNLAKRLERGCCALDFFSELALGSLLAVFIRPAESARRLRKERAKSMAMVSDEHELVAVTGQDGGPGSLVQPVVHADVGGSFAIRRAHSVSQDCEIGVLKDNPNSEPV